MRKASGGRSQTKVLLGQRLQYFSSFQAISGKLKSDTITNMKHLAAYLLLGHAGNTSPSESDIKSVLQSVGIDADEDRLSKLLSELKGKDISAV
jgi:hypothetical protein